MMLENREKRVVKVFLPVQSTSTFETGRIDWIGLARTPTNAGKTLVYGGTISRILRAFAACDKALCRR